MNNSLLVITGLDMSEFSVRGVTQSLELIGQAAQLERTINARLIDLSVPSFRKYRSSISCDDMRTPLADYFYPGLEVTVDCVAELYHAEYGTPSRTKVEGSEYEEGGVVFYRPRLEMMIMSMSTTTDEYGAAVGWTMELEEV